MSNTSVIKLVDDERYIARLESILRRLSGARKLEYVTWLKSIGLEVQYK